jgi:hypothetical protein
LYSWLCKGNCLFIATFGEWDQFISSRKKPPLGLKAGEQ